MQASETKLEQIIEGTKQYVVPLFQRAYSWKKTEWKMLWDDILELYEIDEPRPHFMGSIVTMPTVSVPEGVSKYMLIDGQQRLTTIFILLAALRDRAETSDSELAAEINNTILVNPYKKGLDRYKLQPTQSDREFFHRLIDGEEVSGSDISDCYTFFEKKIRQSKLDIEKIKKVICASLSLISVVLSTEDDPYLVFESLNAKGRPLTQADLIRNYFFMRIHSDDQEDAYATFWKPMQDLLGDNLSEFIRHYLTRNGKDVKQNEIYFEIKDCLNKEDPMVQLKGLFEFSRYYSRLLNSKLEDDKDVSKYLHRINRLEVSTVYPFLLNCYHDWVKNKISKDELVEILKIIENFIVRRFVCNVQTRGLNRIFSTLYLQVGKSSNLASEDFVGRLKLDLQTRDYPKDQEFRLRLGEVKLYGGNRTTKAKLILESIEEFYNHKEQINFEDLSIEHVMPQTLSGWWKEHLGEDGEITHELLIHSLGNLTLTAYNSELSNSPFLGKKNHFYNSHLEINKYFSPLNSWRKEDIEARNRHLIDISLEIWSSFGDSSSQVLKPSGVTGKRPKLMQMFENEYPIKTWREVLEITINEILEREPDAFEDILQQFPRFVGLHEKGFRRSAMLKNGAYIEVNLSAENIYSFCLKALETAGISTEEWSVDTVDS